MSRAIHNENDLNYDGPGPMGWRRRTETSHTAIPVIHWLLDAHGRPCWQVWCACSFLSPPYVDLDVAKCVAWEHQFPGGRISDLRRLCKTHADNGVPEVSSNGNGHRKMQPRLEPCPYCGREFRPCNLKRHMESSTSAQPRDRRIQRFSIEY